MVRGREREKEIERERERALEQPDQRPVDERVIESKGEKKIHFSLVTHLRNHSVISLSLSLCFSSKSNQSQGERDFKNQ